MNKKYIVILTIVSCVLFSCVATDTYKNTDVGFSFKIPKDCYMGTEDKGYNHYYIRIFVQKPEELLDGEKQFLQIEKNINAGVYPNIPNIPTILVKYLTINGIKVGVDFNSGYDVYDGVIGERIFFIKNNKLVSVFFQYEFEGPQDMKDKNNIKIIFQDIQYEYWKKYGANGITPDLDTRFINDLEKSIKDKTVDSRMPKEIVDLFLKFDELLTSLRFK
jgi:hypothetical protein